MEEDIKPEHPLKHCHPVYLKNLWGRSKILWSSKETTAGGISVHTEGVLAMTVGVCVGKTRPSQGDFWMVLGKFQNDPGQGVKPQPSSKTSLTP